MSDNIVDINKFRKDRVKEALSDRVEKTMQEMADEDEFIARFSVETAIQIVEAAYDVEFDVADNPECIKDIMMIIESVAGMMSRIRGVEQPFHDISDGIFKYDKAEAEDLFEDFLQNSGVFT